MGAVFGEPLPLCQCFSGSAANNLVDGLVLLVVLKSKHWGRRAGPALKENMENSKSSKCFSLSLSLYLNPKTFIEYWTQLCCYFWILYKFLLAKSNSKPYREGYSGISKLSFSDPAWSNQRVFHINMQDYSLFSYYFYCGKLTQKQNLLSHSVLSMQFNSVTYIYNVLPSSGSISRTLFFLLKLKLFTH